MRLAPTPVTRRRVSPALMAVLLMCGLLAATGSPASAAGGGTISGTATLPDGVAGTTMQLTADDGTVTGRVTDLVGNPLQGGNLKFFAPSSTDGGDRVYLASASTDANGQYRLTMPEGPAVVEAEVGGYLKGYYGGSDLSSAVPIQVTAGQILSGVDIGLVGTAPINTMRGGITGHPERIGQTVRVSPGEWSRRVYESFFSLAVGMSYRWQWYAVDGAGERPIPGATTDRYTVTSADIGKRFRVAYAASMSGSEWVSALTDLTPTVKRAPKIAITSVKSPKKKTVRLTVRVKASLGATPTGVVRAYCTFTHRGFGGSKDVRLKKGKATLTLKAGHRLSSKSKYGRCTATYDGDATTLPGSTDPKTAKRFRLKLK